MSSRWPRAQFCDKCAREQEQQDTTEVGHAKTRVGAKTRSRRHSVAKRAKTKQAAASAFGNGEGLGQQGLACAVRAPYTFVQPGPKIDRVAAGVGSHCGPP